MPRAEEMRELFVRWRESGQSLMAFGKAEGVSYAKLLYWRRKLGDDVGAARRSAEVDTAASRFVPLEVASGPPPTESQSGTFGVWLSNGMSVDVPHGFDERELMRLVGVLSTC